MLQPAGSSPKPVAPRGPAEFVAELGAELVRACFEFQAGNYDELRFPLPPPARTRAKLRERALDFARRLRWLRTPGDIAPLLDRARGVFARADDYGRTYERLDPRSRRLMVKLLAFRILGGEHVRLPRNNSHYWSSLARVDRELARADAPLHVASFADPLQRFDLRPLSFAIQLYAHRMNVLHTFLLEQYRLSADVDISVGPGDVVVDGGACWGDTALYFAARTGPSGQVFAFEFVPENLEVLRQNVQLNPELAPRIEVVERALWHVSDASIGYDTSGPGSHLTEGQAAGAQARTLSIDDLVESRDLTRLDFLKLDVEGAEANALCGAERTIRRFKPRLAIAVYHRPEDIFEIPDYIAELSDRYEFRLDHFTLHAEETVLFARARA